MSKSPPIKKKEITKHLRFELDVDTYQAFWYVGQKLLGIRTKDKILKELIKIAKEQSK